MKKFIGLYGRKLNITNSYFGIIFVYNIIKWKALKDFRNLPTVIVLVIVRLCSGLGQDVKIYAYNIEISLG